MYAKHDRGQLASSGRRTVGQWLAEWLTIKRPQIEPNTAAFHEGNLRLYLLPVLERVPLTKLRSSHVANLYTQLTNKGVSSATQHHAGVTLSAALNDAVRMGLLASNPAKSIRKPKASRREMRTLDADQVRQFLATAEEDHLHALYVLAIDSGMRQGELFGLLWDSVGFTTGTISISRSLEERHGIHRLKDVKTASSRRRIRVSPAALAALNQHRRKQLAKGVYRDDSPVFCDGAGGWLRKSNFYRDSFLRTLKRAGLPHIRFHDLRHTAATLMLLNGVNVKAVAATLGHAGIRTTLDTYSHFVPAMEEQRIETMQKILAR
jgi:integrase